MRVKDVISIVEADIENLEEFGIYTEFDEGRISSLKFILRQIKKEVKK